MKHTETPYKLEVLDSGTYLLESLAEEPVAIGNNPGNGRFLLKACNNYEKLVETLTEISKGMGKFSIDPLTHASNTIDDMKGLANDALNSLRDGE